LRGSGRFQLFSLPISVTAFCFNPLHCGAVVASLYRSRGWGSLRSCFNPLHCGAVVASLTERRKRWYLYVSIPFIAGQWSLPPSLSTRQNQKSRFNPLHCGAVVASTTARGYVSRAGYSFNPLHCGAVVASRNCP